jgi:UTP--glucose-1-phosphate uridylyltransferase
MDILAALAGSEVTGRAASLSGALAILATREKYLALEERTRRYDLGDKYGLLIAQLALALSGQDREDVLARLLEMVAQRETVSTRRPG